MRYPPSVLLIFFLLATSVRAEEVAPDDAAYEALLSVAKVTSKTVNPAGCLVTAAADVEIYRKKLSIFREAWLNRDYSIDFYNQRQKQVFSHIVLKRFAEIVTEGIFNNQKEATPSDCSFAISVNYADKFGQIRTIPAVSWRFNQKQAAQVNWQNFDPRNFQEIAIDYSLTSEVTEWMSDEPSMTSASSPSLSRECNMFLFRANAIFIRATAFCSKNYMDSKAGYAALAGAKRCASLSNFNEPDVKSTMQELDKIVQQRGRTAACRWVENIARQVVSEVQ